MIEVAKTIQSHLREGGAIVANVFWVSALGSDVPIGLADLAENAINFQDRFTVKLMGRPRKTSVRNLYKQWSPQQFSDSLQLNGVSQADAEAIVGHVKLGSLLDLKLARMGDSLYQIVIEQPKGNPKLDHHNPKEHVYIVRSIPKIPTA